MSDLLNFNSENQNEIKPFDLKSLLPKAFQDIDLTQFLANKDEITVKASTNSNEVIGLHNSKLEITAIVYKSNFQKVAQSPQNYVVKYYPNTATYCVVSKVKKNKFAFD